MSTQAELQSELESKWDALTAKERETIIKKDRSMRDKRWTSLVNHLSNSKASEMTQLQRNSLGDFLGWKVGGIARQTVIREGRGGEGGRRTKRLKICTRTYGGFGLYLHKIRPVVMVGRWR